MNSIYSQRTSSYFFNYLRGLFPLVSICLLFFGVQSHVGAQWSITNTTGTLGTLPEAGDVNTCYELDGELTFRLSSGTMQSNPLIDIALAAGRQYIPGSVMITGSTGGPFTIGANIGSLTNPQFQVTGTFAPGDFINVSLTKIADCGAASGLSDEVTVETVSATSTTHDVSSINLALTGLSSTAITIGGSGVLSGSIVAGGSGCVEEIQITLTDADPNLTTSQLELNGLVITPSSSVGGVLVYDVDISLYSIGDGDDCLEAGEQIDFERSIDLAACDDFSGVGMEASWGCNATVCQTTGFIPQTVNVGGGIGDVTYVTGSYTLLQSSNTCTNWIQEVQFSNDPMAGPAYNVSLLAAYNNFGVTTFTTGNQTFVEGRIGGMPITVTSGRINDLNDLFMTDPDGPGGLEDLDMDGFFDDLAPGDTITWEIEWMRASCRDNCPVNYGNQSMSVQAGFTDVCGMDITSSPDGIALARTNNSPMGDPVVTIPANIFEGDMFTVTALITRNHRVNRPGEIFQCPTDSLVLRITTPPGIGADLGSATIANDAMGMGESSVTAQRIDDTTIIVNGFLNDLPPPFTSTRFFSIDLEAIMGMCDANVQDFKFDIFYICDEACDCIENYVCDVISTPSIICNAPCPTGGPRIGAPEASRATLGFTDQTETTKVDPSTVSEQWLQTATHCDTICWSFTAYQEGGTSGPTWDSVGVGIQYTTYATGQPTFDFIAGGEFVWFDSSAAGGTGTYSAPCAVGPSSMDVFEADTNFVDWDLTSCLGGMVLETGDSVFVTVKAVVRTDAGIPTGVPDAVPDLVGRVYNVIDGEDIGCSSPLTIPQRLHTFNLVHPFGSSGYTGGCDDVAPSESYTFLSGPNALVYYPEEHRPLYRIDSVRYRTDLTRVIYDPTSSLSLRYRDPSGAAPFFDVGPATTVNDTYTVWINDGTWPNTDVTSGITTGLRTAAFFPSCASVNGIIPIEIFYTTGINGDTSCQENRLNTFNRSVNFTFAELELADLTGETEAVGSEVCWDIELTNVSNTGTGFVWVAFEGLDVTVDSVRDVAADTLLNIMNFSRGQWASIKDDFVGNESIVLQVCGSIDTCTNRSLTAYTGWACDTFPSSPDSLCYTDSVELPFRIPPSAVQITLSQDQSQEVYEFCQIINDTITIISADAGNISDVVLEILPADGLTEDDLTVQVEYPEGSGMIENIPVTLSGDTLIIDVSQHTGIAMNGISGTLDAADPSESMATVIVNWLVGCEFRDGAMFFTDVFANDFCGDPVSGNGVSTMSSPIPGVQQASVLEGDLGMSEDTVFNCEPTMISVVANMILGNSTGMDSIFISLPVSTKFVNGTFMCSPATPAAACPVLEYIDSVSHPDQEILVFSIPTGITAPTEIILNFDIESTPNSICVDSSDLELLVIQFNADVPCDALGMDSVCSGLQFVLLDTFKTLYFDPVDFELVGDTVLCPGVFAPLEVIVSEEDSCVITNGTWSTPNGSGSFTDSASLTNTYIPGPGDGGKNVIIVFETATTSSSNCEPLRDTVVICYGPNSVNCLSNLNVGCGEEINVEDLVSFDISEKLTKLFTIRIEDEYGREVSNPLPRNFRGELWAHVFYECTGATCETEIEVSDKSSCSIVNTLDTTLWCVDEFLDVDVLSDYYKDTLKLRPVAMDGCSGDTLGYAEYAGEWVTTFECGPSTGSGQGDTLKQILRRWYWENKDGSECSAFDTLTLIRLPNIAEYIYAPQKDTVSCVYDTILDSTEIYNEVCWKQMVGLHSDGTMIYYPVDETDVATAGEVLIIRRNGLEETVEDIRTNYASVFYRGKQSYEVEVFEGDRVLSNDSRFIHVDEDWFYLGDGSQHVTWIDICVPFISYRITEEVCDVWDDRVIKGMSGGHSKEGTRSGGLAVCESVQLILPDHPYTPDSCKVFCLNELTGDDKCVEVIHVESKDLGGSCPRVEKRSTLVKQTCFATGVATLDSLVTTCPVEADSSGITRLDTLGDSLFMEVEQWIIYEDTLPPLEDEIIRVIRYTTDAHSCEGDVEIPSIDLKDVCSGVKAAKATLVWNGQEMGLGWVELSDADGDGVWEQEEGARRLRLACGGPYEVRYEAVDECHNTLEVDLHTIYMEDRVAPTVLTDDTLRLSLGGKEVWLPAETFDENSTDNCSIEKILVRRADWIEACGVDACPGDLSGITSYAELNSYIAANGITVGLGDSDIERTYAEQYEWLVEDGQWCEDDYVREQLILGWEEDIKNAWIEDGCIGVDEHGNSILSTSNNSLLGGGWGNAVPFCCEDACEEVVVEVLVIDKGCNFTRGWVVVNVEDKSTVEKAMDFDELTIGCSSYDERYGFLLEAAAEGNEAAKDQLDELLGGLAEGWRSDDNRLVDYDGNEIKKAFSYMTSKCSTEVIERKVLDTAHDGEVIWEIIEEEVNVLYEEEAEAEVGGVFVKCGSRVERDVWIELKDCGQGKVTRRWLVYGGCEDRSLSGAEGSGAEMSDHSDERPLIFEQVIYVVSDCELSKASLNVPNDTMICSDLIYTLSGNLDLEVEELSYGLGDLSCRELGIGYEDEILRIVGDADKRKVHRTWTVNDWCSGEVIECVQKIVVDMNCTRSLSGVEGSGAEATASEETSRADSDARGNFQLYQNRPNPFVDQSVIRFRLPVATRAKLTLFDASGRILQVIEKTYAAGVHEEVINARELGSRVGGVIYYQLDTDTHSATRQMVRLR